MYLLFSTGFGKWLLDSANLGESSSQNGIQYTPGKVLVQENAFWNEERTENVSEMYGQNCRGVQGKGCIRPRCVC